MGFESLSHTPEFELPMNGPNAPADLLGLIEEVHVGLTRAVVSKMRRRGSYEQVAQITCQENPNPKTQPNASPQDIADYCMLCMQYEREKSDEPGNYKVTLFGAPGKGRFERSKHVDLTDSDGEARSTSLLSEAELCEQQRNYIGELHSQAVASGEMMQTVMKTILHENKEMMKIVSESQRKMAEIERDRLNHDLQLKIHNDEIKQREAEQEAKMERWRELLKTVNDTGAPEALFKAIAARIKNAKGDDEKTKTKTKQKPKSKTEQETKTKTDQPESETCGEEVKKEPKSEKAKKRKKGSSKKKNKKKKTVEAESQNDEEELSTEQLEKVFKDEGLDKAQENPLSVAVAIVKMGIDENEQWEIIEKTLTKDQLSLFKEILECEGDAEIEEKLKALYNLKGARRLMKLEEHLDEEQMKFVEMLFEVASS